MAKFSIILPVRNGGEYVKECVQSILAQTCTDLDLHILDNCSTDGTLEWIRTIADTRIKIYAADRPLSIEENWDRVKMIPKNEFMTLIGHDDRLYEDYLATMQGLIAASPDASLYQAHFTYIDAKGRKIRDSKPMASIETAGSFLEKILENRIDVMGTGFMMRSEEYNAVGGIPLYPNLLFADFALWISVAKIRFMATSPALGFSFRLHQSMTSASADIRFQQAFEAFIFFLEALRKEKPEYSEIIRKHAGTFLLFYCRGLSHRLLRTPKAKRNDLSVKSFVSKCNEYAYKLGVDRFNPQRQFSIRLARVLDSTMLGRRAFLLFKKLFPRPILK